MLAERAFYCLQQLDSVGFRFFADFLWPDGALYFSDVRLAQEEHTDTGLTDTAADVEADIDSAVDADTISETGAKVIQLHTGGMCHLDADMTRQGLLELDTSDVDLAILENVGNLVCPAEFDTGAVKNAMILSVPEGDDKPLKYPLMFQVCQCLLINKIDVLPYFDFDLEECKKRVLKLNPDMKIIPISARTGEGMDEWIDWLKEETSSWNESNEKGVKE